MQAALSGGAATCVNERNGKSFDSFNNCMCWGSKSCQSASGGCTVDTDYDMSWFPIPACTDCKCEGKPKEYSADEVKSLTEKWWKRYTQEMNKVFGDNIQVSTRPGRA